MSVCEYSSATITYNALNQNSEVNNSTFSNNIFENADMSNNENCTYYNNIFGINEGASFIPSGNDNLSNVNMDDVYAYEAGGSYDRDEVDNRFLLKAGSVAEDHSTDGLDCGMFGGPTPYVLSGLPDLPRITYFTAPAMATETSGLRVHLKAAATSGD